MTSHTIRIPENVSTEIVPVEKVDTLPVSSEGGIYDMPVAVFKDSLTRRGENRKALIAWLREALVDGTDKGRIHILKKEMCALGKDCKNDRHFSKECLFKSGAEKITGMLSLTATFPNARDYEQKALRGEKIETVVLRCELLSGGRVVGEGMGARSVAQDKGDLNKTIKMCQKSAFVDATIRTGGLSEVVTQDIEDMVDKNGGGLPEEHPIDKRPPPPPANEAAADLQDAWDEGKTRETEKVDGKAVIAAIMGHLKSLGGDPLGTFRKATGVATMKGASLVQLQWYLKLVEEYAKRKKTPVAPPAAPKTDTKEACGVIADLQAKSGTGKRGAWNRVGILVGEDWFGTFDDEIGKDLITFYDASRPVCIAYTVDNKGYNTIVSISEDEPPEQHPKDGDEGVPF